MGHILIFKSYGILRLYELNLSTESKFQLMSLLRRFHLEFFVQLGTPKLSKKYQQAREGHTKENQEAATDRFQGFAKARATTMAGNFRKVPFGLI